MFPMTKPALPLPLPPQIHCVDVLPYRLVAPNAHIFCLHPRSGEVHVPLLRRSSFDVSISGRKPIFGCVVSGIHHRRRGVVGILIGGKFQSKAINPILFVPLKRKSKLLRFTRLLQMLYHIFIARSIEERACTSITLNFRALCISPAHAV